MADIGRKQQRAGSRGWQGACRGRTGTLWHAGLKMLARVGAPAGALHSLWRNRDFDRPAPNQTRGVREGMQVRADAAAPIDSRANRDLHQGVHGFKRNPVL